MRSRGKATSRAPGRPSTRGSGGLAPSRDVLARPARDGRHADRSRRRGRRGGGPVARGAGRRARHAPPSSSRRGTPPSRSSRAPVHSSTRTPAQSTPSPRGSREKGSRNERTSRQRRSTRSRCRTSRRTFAGARPRRCSSTATASTATELLKRTRATALAHGFLGLEHAITALARTRQLRLGPARTTVDGDEALSVRELEVLRLLVDGKSNPEIASPLHHPPHGGGARLEHPAQDQRVIPRRSRVRGASTRIRLSLGGSVELRAGSGHRGECHQGGEGRCRTGQLRLHGRCPLPVGSSDNPSEVPGNFLISPARCHKSPHPARRYTVVLLLAAALVAALAVRPTGGHLSALAEVRLRLVPAILGPSASRS